jgi:hypothetical protein
MWADAGGSASANVCEKDGLGHVTYYLVIQKGVWKLHYMYFSLKPIPLDEIKTITGSMRTLIE